MITFQNLTQHIQADYVKQATSKEILRALNRVIADINSKMPMIEKVYPVSETYVTGALTGNTEFRTITGTNSQFEKLLVGDCFNISGSVFLGETNLDGNYTITSKITTNEVIVKESVANGTSSTTTKVNYMYNSSLHVNYDYTINTLRIVSPFIEIDDILVDNSEYEIVTDYVFENADSTDEYLRFVTRDTIEFLTDLTSSEIAFRMIKQYDELSSVEDTIELPDEYQQLIIFGVARNLMMLPKYIGLYKESVEVVAQSYISEFESRAKKEYDRLPDRDVELEYKY